MSFFPLSVLVCAMFTLSFAVNSESTPFYSLRDVRPDDSNPLLKTYDFDQDGFISSKEFASLFINLFKKDEQRFVPHNLYMKVFDLLDLDNDKQLNSEEFRKIFHHLILPVISTKSCFFICLPNENAPSVMDVIAQLKTLFKAHYVFISSCHIDPQVEKINKLVNQTKQVLPNAYAVAAYDMDSHKESIQSRDFDQIVVSVENIASRNAMDTLLSLNSQIEHPTVLVADDRGTNHISDIIDEEDKHVSIIVSPGFVKKPAESVRYKINLTLLLARKIYRKYKQF